VAHTVLVYSIIIVIGVFFGRIKIFGVSLGITFVLFAGLAAGHLGVSVNHSVIEFVKDFGLILFVFSIGLQVGPGFFASFKKGGVSLNVMAMIIVLLGGLTTVSIHFVTGFSMPMLVGIMSGAVTNTPGLGAAQQALSQTMDGPVPEIGLGYAVAYPFGILGIIITMSLIRKIFSVNIQEERESFSQFQYPKESLPEKISITVKSHRAIGKPIMEVTGMIKYEFVISRLMRNVALENMAYMSITLSVFQFPIS
jgi:putative transport protein